MKQACRPGCKTAKITKNVKANFKSLKKKPFHDIAQKLFDVKQANNGTLPRNFIEES